ncbi:MAG: polysaccharide biosynthesis C-terminal domain-containing protein, partial [Clostridia bacterium]|nr:polysaccharide biosynthesis C-terminal domain-containing protein [Clostridia bacterium]
TPMINALISMVANIVVAYLLAGRLGISGLAIATACGSTVNAVLNFVCIKKHYKTVFETKDRKDISKILVSSVIMALGMYLISSVLSSRIELGFSGGIIIGGIAGIFGAICYIGFCLIFKVNILLDFIKGVKNK